MTFTRKAAGELRSRLRRLGLRDEVTAGTFHALAYAQLRQRWAERGDRAADVARTQGGASRPDPPGATGSIGRRPRRRDRVGQGQDRLARGAMPEARSVGRATPACSSLDEMAAVYAPLRGREATATAGRLRRSAVAVPRAARAATPSRRRPRGGGSATCSSTSSRTSTRCSSGCSRPGGATGSTCALSATRTRRSTAGTAPIPAYSPDFVDRFAGAEVVVLDHNYRSTPQILAMANCRARGRWSTRRCNGSRPAATGCGRAGPRAAVPVEVVHATDRDEARSVARRVFDRNGPGVPLVAPGRPGAAPTPRRCFSRRRSPRSASPAG